LRNKISAVNASGISILLVEQNVALALSICERIYIMEKGVIRYEGTSKEIRENPDIAHRFLGVALKSD
jgi:branched-chain amino acid transport system ATP-binding protein